MSSCQVSVRHTLVSLNRIFAIFCVVGTHGQFIEDELIASEPGRPLDRTRPPLGRNALAFFLVGRETPERKLIYETFQQDGDVVMVEKATVKESAQHMIRSKFCIQTDGNAPWSPRLMQYVLTGCVPVVVSNKLLPPFHKTLNWSTFSLRVPVADIARLKHILTTADHAALFENLQLAKQLLNYNLQGRREKSQVSMLNILIFEMWQSVQQQYES